MRKIRLLALDLDDTLLRSDLSISYRTRNAIKRTETAGVTVVLASGRIPAAMERFSRLLGMHKRPGYVISNNGTLIQESHTGNVIHEVRIEPEIALAACDLAAAEGFAVQIYEDDIMYVSRQNEYTSYDQKLTGLRQVVVENFRAMVGQGCYKLLIPGDPMLLAPLEIILRTYLGKDITLFTSKPYYLEILPPETNKGTALARIAEIMDMDKDEVLAIGDSMNDEDMIRWAGTGVAMANGDERIKNIADLVTDRSNDDDGVAEIIDKFILGKG
ncbi:MAG: Cof-type HAD-IIB family hydrolase [Treponema sp.]|jgi:Cof subfamily protein (haloacid dehalogenase superfamily)|nr:Cof-type HAD-IIB family hydrolase [Treponema sp.]